MEDKGNGQVLVTFDGGPWHGQSVKIDSITAPLYSVSDYIGRHYWLDVTSDPPIYRWHDGE